MPRGPMAPIDIALRDEPLVCRSARIFWGQFLRTERIDEDAPGQLHSAIECDGLWACGPAVGAEREKLVANAGPQ